MNNLTEREIGEKERGGREREIERVAKNEIAAAAAALCRLS